MIKTKEKIILLVKLLESSLIPYPLSHLLHTPSSFLFHSFALSLPPPLPPNQRPELITVSKSNFSYKIITSLYLGLLIYHVIICLLSFLMNTIFFSNVFLKKFQRISNIQCDCILIIGNELLTSQFYDHIRPDSPKAAATVSFNHLLLPIASSTILLIPNLSRRYTVLPTHLFCLSSGFFLNNIPNVMNNIQ